MHAAKTVCCHKASLARRPHRGVLQTQTGALHAQKCQAVRVHRAHSHTQKWHVNHTARRPHRGVLQTQTGALHAQKCQAVCVHRAHSHTQKWHVDHTARNATHLFGWSSGAAIRARSRHSGSKGPVRRNTNIYQRRITKFTMPCRSRLRFPPALGCSNVS